MDPLTILVTALVTGAAEKLKPTAGKAVEEAYEGLKALLLRKFGDKEDVSDAVDKVEGKPGSQAREGLLKEELEAAGAHEDEELLAAAKALLEQADPQGAQQDKYSITFHGEVKGAVIGDHAQVEQKFGGEE
jgi:hypothetical protein